MRLFAKIVGIMPTMTTEIISAAKTAMTEKGISQADLAKLLDISENHVSRILQGKSNQLPTFWQTAFDALGLRLIVVPENARVTITKEV